MKRIQRVVVLGSGIMGSGIACHFANIGVEVLMLDILPPAEKLETGTPRNAIAATALNNALNSNPAPLYKKEFSSRISTGNFEDDFPKIKNYDWIIEVVIERLDIKKSIFEKVDQYRAKGSIVTSNTSGIPLHLMAEGRSEDFRKNFCGTHFFNPPRYLKLLEIIPTADTSQELIHFLMNFGEINLGKLPVLCKDTPGFIANRIGVYAMARIFALAEKYNLPPSTVDKLTGPAIGRPKTGTFRLGDLVGLDTAVKVIEGIKQSCPDDYQIQSLETPSFLNYLIENKYFGDKSGKGFYQKTGQKDENGRPVILSLNYQNNQYETAVEPKLPSLATAKQIEDFPKRLKSIWALDDDGARLIKESFGYLFAYAAHRIPEIADHIYSIDNAIKAGFAWDLGPFECWDILGLETGIEAIKAVGDVPPAWITDMRAKGHLSFYENIDGEKAFYDIESQSYKSVPKISDTVRLSTYRGNAPVYKNDEILLHDIGDGVLCLEFTSKMNAIGEGILSGLNVCIELAENGEWKGLVIGNEAKNFSVGANLMLIAMLAFQQEWDQLDMAVRLFQNTTMKCRYSKIPVVLATQGYVFGGGCEMLMHTDASACAAESYIGLVEAGVGLIPGGGGTKEFALRASDAYFDGDVQIPTLIEKFKTIAMAKVATSAWEAYDLGYLNAKDEVVVNTDHVITRAKSMVLNLAEGYTAPIPRKDVKVLGRSGLGALYAAVSSLELGKYISSHDALIARKMAYVLCGGDLTGEQNVSEKYLLDIEREAFLSLCGETKTLERIQYMLEKGKPLRN